MNVLSDTEGWPIGLVRKQTQGVDVSFKGEGVCKVMVEKAWWAVPSWGCVCSPSSREGCGVAVLPWEILSELRLGRLGSS